MDSEPDSSRNPKSANHVSNYKNRGDYMEKVYAIIPVKEKSNRIKRKNFIDFYKGLSLLEIKIQQCISSGVFSDVFVSSDAEEAELISKKYNIKFIKRDPYFCDPLTPWGEVIKGVALSVPAEDDAFLMWLHVTNPLFKNFNGLIEALKNNPGYDSCSTVTEHHHFMLNSDYLPINHKWGPWHTYTQGTKPVYQLNLAASLIRKRTMAENRYILGDMPYFHSISFTEGLDIDTHEEFLIAQLLYNQLMNPRSTLTS
ncbi:cytidylyltransferase domain-containing protein [Asticcacaulis excentricus]|nr:capsular biosynthesis protein [Asticcacaulis excentricus]